MIKTNKIISNNVVIAFFIALAVPFLYLIYLEETRVFILPAILGISVVMVLIKNPRLWLYSVIALFLFFTRSRGEEVSGDDYFFAFYYIGGIVYWLFWAMVVKREKIVKNIADFIILLFFFLLLANIMLAYFNEVPLFSWFREYGLATIILYYFPIRYYFHEEKHIKRLLIFFAIVIFMTSMVQFYMYYQMLSNFQYAYQLAINEKINQMIFTVAAVSGVLFTFYQKNLKYQLLMLLFTGTVGFALLTTFSRTFWVLFVFGTILIFYFLPNRKKLNLIKVFLALLIISIAGITMILGENSDMFYKLITNRLKSTTKGRKDISLQSRLVEYKYAVKQIERYPIGGNGLAKQVHFLNPIGSVTFHTHNIHNGYIYLAFRTGIPMTIMYLFFLIYYLFIAFLVQKKFNYGFPKLLLQIGFINITLLLIANLTSAQFFYRDAYFVIFMNIAIIGIAIEQYKQLAKNSE